MKKSLIFIIILGFIFCLNLSSIKAKGISEIIVNYYESDYYDIYLEKSSQFVFNEDMLDTNRISECLAQINATSNYELEFVYNIYGVSQYLLIEENSSFNTAYIIYDFMLEEAIEYNDKCLSIWSLNQKAIDSVKFYLNFNSKFYIRDNVLYDAITDNTISSVDDLYINDQHYKESEDILLNSIEIESFQNRVIKDEYDIKDAFFFKNFSIDKNNKFNEDGSCTVVSVALLLSYYDTFFNDNIVPDKIEYNGKTYLTTNDVAQNVLKNSDSIYTDSFYLDQWTATNFIINGECELNKNGNLPGSISPAGPTREFHDYLFEVAIDKNYYSETFGISILSAKNLINNYFSENSVEGISAAVNINDSNIIDCLNNDIPVILGMGGYDYYIHCNDPSNPIIGYRASFGSFHSVVAYGYQITSIGTFYHINMGWPNINIGTGENSYTLYRSDTYISPVLMGNHAYIDVADMEHVCSEHYKIYDKNSGISISICPCTMVGDNIKYIECDVNLDYVDINNDTISDLSFNHLFDVYEIYDENQHIKKCRLFEYCGKSEFENHNYVLIGSSNDFYHYIKCRDCGYTKYESHLDSDIEMYNSEQHSRYCSYCLEYYDSAEHLFHYTGNDESHEGICRDCDYVQEYDTHNITINYYYENSHVYLCDCGYERYESHTFDEDLICTLCGYEHLSHTYSYSKYSGSQHIKYCLCGEEIYESHSFNIGLLGNICKHCGYFTKDLVTIDSIINDKEYDANGVLYLDNMDKEDDENDK
ncbi:MAG: hypothetical protein J6K18_01980 [Bacilli bacterium]|nr:hypothetical protein [Bacilli bacterium]